MLTLNFRKSKMLYFSVFLVLADDPNLLLNSRVLNHLKLRKDT